MLYKNQGVKPKGGLFILMLCLLFVVPVEASQTSSNLQDAKNRKQQTQDKINDTKENISDLNSERASIQEYVENLNSELQSASMQLAEIEQLIDEKEQGVRLVQKELEDAKEAQVQQYDAMKTRIKFMYESRDATYINIIFSSGSISEFLNKTEYIQKITEYDRRMLQEYVKLQDEIKQEESDLQDSQTALEGLRKEAGEKAESVQDIIKKANENLSAYREQIAEQEKRMVAYEQQLNAANNDIKTFEEQLKAQEKMTQASVMRDLSNVTISGGDIDLMAAIIECEAGGESYTGKVAVGAVVMNRVKSSSFPNTILEVIYQNKQFSPVASGRFAVVLARGANETCYQAARDAMSGVTPVGDKLFFRTPIAGLTGQQIGGHIFY